MAIITYCRREDGHAGGVPKHAWYLRRALEEAGHEVDHYAWRDLPDWERHDHAPEYAKAQRLSGWIAWVSRRSDSYDQFVVDGFWGCGLPEAAPVTVVCHGTWAGLAAACGGVDRELIAAQGEAYRRFPVVAVSEAAARQAEAYHAARVAAVIPNGVDLDAFRPAARAAHNPPVVVYAGKGCAKGEDIVGEVALLLDDDARVEYLDAPVGMEARALQRGDVFLFPSRHEGDSYALKEALACGLPAVASAVGMFEEQRPTEVGEIVEGFDAADYCAALKRVLENREGYAPRRWAREHAGLREFARRWREWLENRR